MANKLVFVFIGVVVAVANADYCRLCSDHVACPEDKTPSPNCVGIPEITQEIIDHILAEHNKLRNKLAAGEVTGFEPATRMATLQWDGELAYLAYFNSKKCSFGHDACRKTNMFPYAGQNIAGSSIAGAGADYQNVMEVITNQTQNWFDEYKYTSPDVIKAYHGTGNPNKENGHFTQIARDQSMKVGCSVSQYLKEGGWYTTYYVCNYAVTNIKSNPIYDEGSTASKCKTGTNPKYPSLCSESEKYDDSDFIKY